MKFINKMSAQLPCHSSISLKIASENHKVNTADREQQEILVDFFSHLTIRLPKLGQPNMMSNERPAQIVPGVELSEKGLLHPAKNPILEDEVRLPFWGLKLQSN
jgi:hypothetical protein